MGAQEQNLTLEGRIRAAYLRVTGGALNQNVRLALLRVELHDEPVDAVERELRIMEQRGAAVLSPMDNRRLRPDDEVAAMRVSGERRDLFRLRSEAPADGPWATACDLVDRAKRGKLTPAELALSTGRNGKPSSWFRHRVHIATRYNIDPAVGQELDDLGVPFRLLRWIAYGTTLVERERRLAAVRSHQPATGHRPAARLPAALETFVRAEVEKQLADPKKSSG